MLGKVRALVEGHNFQSGNLEHSLTLQCGCETRSSCAIMTFRPHVYVSPTRNTGSERATYFLVMQPFVRLQLYCSALRSSRFLKGA